MKLYRLTKRFSGPDVDEVMTLGYVVASTAAEVADHLNIAEHYGAWYGYALDQVPLAQQPQAAAAKRVEYIERQGDFHEPYGGGTCDKKWGWEEVGPITEAEAAVLRSFGITQELQKPEVES
ncbi:hypothetical protein HOI18_01500 [Candidatus Uhrbacteria bacterium]|jgi:hypothetical protein|nr:hypothetical protein [Candidatus Uhrbacteria bacterium]